MRWTPVLLLIPIPVCAQMARPVVGPVPSFAVPAISEMKVGGMTASLVPYGTTPTARVELVLRSGRASEAGEREAGLAQLVGDYLLDGTAARGGTALAQELASIGAVGGGLTVSVGAYETIIAGEVLSESAPRLVEIIAEVATRPAFDPAGLDRLKDALRRRSQVTGPAAVAAARVNAILFPGDPADRVPSETELAALTIDDVRRFYTREYVAARAHLYVAGVFDRPAARAAVHSAFGSFRPGTAAAPLPATIPRAVQADTAPVIYLIDRPGATQTRIHVAYPIVDAMHPDHLVLNQLRIIMGSVQTSRIIANVRERRGYSYNIAALVVRRPGATTWTVQGDVNREVTGAALREILKELDGIAANPPAADEIGEFQRFMSGITLAEMATARGLLEYLRFGDLYRMPPGYLGELIPSIGRVSPADLLRVDSAYLTPQRRVIVLVGDAAQLEPQLREWGRVVR